MNKNTMHFVKIAIYILIAIVSIIIVWFSKVFFDNNYRKNEIFESNVKIYKVYDEASNEGQESTETKVVEEEPSIVHHSPTDVIIDTIVTEQDINHSQTQTEKSVDDSQVQTKQDTELTSNKQNSTNLNEESNVKEPNIKPDKDITKKPSSNKKQKDRSVKKPKTLQVTEPISKSILENPAFSSYVIQVGAFSDISEAKKYISVIKKIDDIKKFNFSISYSKSTKLHRVMIGYFETSDSASVVCQKLKGENVQCFVTKL